MHPLLRLLEKPSRLVIGFMSGTSADGIDAALVRIAGSGLQTKAELLAFCFTPFSEPVRAEILRLAGGGSARAADFCNINFLLGALACEAGEALCREAGVRREEIDLIGHHGQTLWHIPQEESYLGHRQRSTLQLGEDALLAECFGCPVVGDFRVRDMAAGGQGAPLVSYTEFLLYRREDVCVALENLGGIGNVTVMPAGCGLDGLTAFDTGPGNMVLDALAARLTGGEKRFDDGGALAAQGEVRPKLLAHMLEDPYLRLPPPKTTGREAYGSAYVDALCAFAAARGIPLIDVLATATRFTAETVAYGLKRFAPVQPRCLIVGGGGCRNPVLMRHLADVLPDCEVLTNEELGLSSDAKEAVAFAVLANEAVFAGCNSAPAATGARHPVVMGKISV